MLACSGIIYSNTDLGLEGNNFQQENMPPSSWPKKENYFIGPILPEWYESALDDMAVKDARLKQGAVEHECLRFMDAQENSSVVYVGTGSHIELEPEQAQAIINELRKHKTPWVLLCRQETEAMRKLLGGDEIRDGIVTDWAPQLEMLIHPALKCVISHGGFGTLIEGVYAGQPFITTPVASDQFVDSKVMQHLGISLGTIAENRHMPVMQRTKLTPFWPDDGGKHLQELFQHVFGTEQGKKDLVKAREASLALRKRMGEVKMNDGVAQLERLRHDMTS